MMAGTGWFILRYDDWESYPLLGGGGTGVVNHGLWSATFGDRSPGPELLLHYLVIYNHKALLHMVDLCIPPDLQFIFAEQVQLHFLLSAYGCQSKYPQDLLGNFPDLPSLRCTAVHVCTVIPILKHLRALVLFSRAGVWTRLMGCVRPSRRPSTRPFRRLWISWRKTVTFFVPPSTAN